MKTKLITAFVAVTLTFTGIFATPMAVAAECPLCGPAENGDISEVKRLIAFGADVNVKNDSGRTALIIATNNGHAKIVKILLDTGADVNAKSFGGSTPLTWSKKAEITKMFLDAGANVNAKDNNGGTPLMDASGAGQTEIVKVLLDAGADVNVEDNVTRWTALIKAAYDGHAEVVKILLDAGATKANSTGETAARWAVINGHSKLAKFIRTYKPDTDSPLMKAVLKGNLKEIKRLILARANVNAKNNDGLTALMYAAVEGKTKIVKILLDAGVDVDAKNNFGKTAAETAKLGGHTEVANLIKNYKHSKSAVEIKEKTEKAKVEKKQKSRNETKTETPLTACYDRMTRFCDAGEHDFSSDAVCIKTNHRGCRVIY